MVWANCAIGINCGADGVFYSGDIVTGSVVLEFKKEQKIKNVEFKVIGMSKARWSRVMPTVPYIMIYSEKRKVLDISIDIFRELKVLAKDTTTILGIKIPPGLNDYQFHFALPYDLPSTFKSSIGSVEYFIEINSKGAYNRKKRKFFPFDVMTHLDLNHSDEFKVPMIFELSKTFTTSGMFSLYFKTYRGFAPKQTIPMEVDITNDKRVTITKINVILLQKLEYSVLSGYANDEKKICKVEHDSFLNDTRETCRLVMNIPQVAPSSVNATDPIVNVSYVLRVEVIFRYHLTLYKEIPVTISTVPVMHHSFSLER